MVFNFGAGYGWDDVSAERVVEMISHLHPASIEGLWITNAPYGSSFMDALIEWIKNANHIKSLAIEIHLCGWNEWRSRCRSEIGRRIGNQEQHT